MMPDSPNVGRNARMSVQIQAHNLSISVSASTGKWEQIFRKEPPCHSKTVLDNVSLTIPSGSLTAILGESGSGKTSLLNVLSGRMQKSNLLISGHVTYNNQHSSGIASAYLVQQDVLPVTLTVRETLRYAAVLRLDAYTDCERETVVEDVISKLGLTRCADTRIGDEKRKGCSGGEKRRVSIAIQLLTDASVLFCDEPTTGLDATTALHLIKTLSELARSGMTVIMSVHAPRSDAWDLFDHVVLLSQGCLLYDGPSNAAREHFEQCGYPMPLYVNPPDFFLDTIAVDSRSDEAECRSLARIQHLHACWTASSRSTSMTAPSSLPRCEEKQALPRFAGIARQCKVLSQRTFTTCIRDRTSLLTIWCAVAGIAAINGWIFWRLDGSIRGIRSRQGSLWAATGLYGYLILVNEICRLVEEIRLFDHERKDKIITAGAFLLGRRVARFILEDLALPTLFTLIYYPMVGYRGYAPQVFIFWAVMLLTHYIAIGFATVSVSITRSLHGAGLMGCLFFTLQMLASAFFIQAQQMPVYVRWLKWLTHTFYTFGALCENEFIGVHASPHGHFYDCPYSHDPSDPRCREYTGVFIVDNLGLPGNWIWRPLVILCAIAILFHITSVVILHYHALQSDTNKGERRVKQHDVQGDMDETLPSKPTNQVTVHLSDYYLEAKMKGSIIGNSRPPKRLFGPVSMEFQPGQLNAIMGPSGSGKTSLLLSLSHRLSSAFRPGGSITVNGVQMPKHQMKSMISFVSQDDNALMPALTVRETLFFAAHLKLPTTMPAQEKQARVEETISRFGLRSCANTLVGHDFVRGISGGEKRRLSIACETIRMPDVLVLDEPTSGLDSFTALSIIEVLHGLAASGRTIILSIHQPTSSIWPYLSRCLLLAPHGLPVYSGQTSGMLSYFSQRGFDCPTTINPADFVVDLVTPDLGRKPIRQARNESSISLSTGAPPNLSSSRPPFRVALPLLLRRAALNTSRQPISIFARSIQVPGMGLMLTLFVAPFKHDYHSVQTRMGFIQQFATLAFIGMIQNVATFPPERDIFYRENSESLYSAEAFLLQYTMLELPFELFSSILFSLLATYAARLQPTPHMFGILLLNSFFTLHSGESMSMVSSILTSHLGMAVNLTCVVLAVFTVLGGVMSLDAPGVLQAINHLSPIKYAISNVAIFSMRGLDFTCTDGQRMPDGKCPIQTGEDVLRLYNLDQKDPWLQVLGVVLCAVGYRLLAYTLLKVKTVKGDFWGVQSVIHRIMRWMR